MGYNFTSPYDFADSYKVNSIIEQIQEKLEELKTTGIRTIKHDAKRGHYIEFTIPDAKLTPFDQAFIRKQYKGSGWSDIIIMLGTPTTNTVYLYLPQ